MRRMTTLAATFCVALFTCTAAQAVQILQESFENPPGTTYTLDTAFDDGSFDYFGRYEVPDNSNGARDDFQVGWDGQWGIHSQDNDGEGGPATVSLTTTPINSQAPQHIITMALGALNSEPDFDNYEADDGDGIEIFATLSSQDFLVGAFKPNDTGASDLYRDTNLDGVGDGDRLTTELADFSFPVSGSPGDISVRVELTSTDGFEPLALDNIRIEAIPEPTALLLSMTGIGLLGMMRRRRS